MTAASFSPKRLTRVRDLLDRLVDQAFVPGVVAVLARRGDVNIESTGNLAFEAQGPGRPWRATRFVAWAR